MRMAPRLQRQLAWLALCAVLFAAAAPTVSKWLAASQPAFWAEVCSTTGAAPRAAWDLGSKSGSDRSAVSDSHCGYCLLQHHTPVVPTAPYDWEPVTASAERLPIGSGGTTVVKRFVRSAHLARAPPAFS